MTGVQTCALPICFPVTILCHGIRAYWDGKELFSKNKNKIFAPSWFTKDFPPFPLDGELGIDGRSDNGFVWLYDIQNLENIQPVPEWVKTIVRKPINQIDTTRVSTYQIPSHIGQQKFNEALDMLRNAQEGERNHTLNKVSYIIGQLVAAQAVPYDYAYEQINQVALSIGLEPFEIQATSLSGLKGGFTHPPSHPFGDAPPVPALKIEAPLPQAETPSRWTPKFATEAMLWDWSKLKRPQLS